MAHTIDYKTKMEKGYDYSASFYDERAGQSMTSFTHLFLDDLQISANPVSWMSRVEQALQHLS